LVAEKKGGGDQREQQAGGGYAVPVKRAARALFHQAGIDLLPGGFGVIQPLVRQCVRLCQFCPPGQKLIGFFV
jgi:hypothetical protein